MRVHSRLTRERNVDAGEYFQRPRSYLPFAFHFLAAAVVVAAAAAAHGTRKW